MWKFQLALMAKLGKKCDYVAMTNPHDADAPLSANVQWPYLSLAAAPLAAYRQALVQTGDYTGDRKALHALGGALGDTGDKAKYALVKPVFQKVKDDSYAAEKFLADSGHPPRFLGMVGGAIELPYYICDIHAKYKYWDTQIDYVPADTPYATMRSDVDYSQFVRPDLGVGRIMADSVLDATLMLARTFFRKEFLPGGTYAALAPAGWEKKAVLYDGHRLNQPDEGGPDASPNEPFYPANEVREALDKSGLKTDYVVPRDETKKDDAAPTAAQLLEKTGAYGAVQFIAHGDPPFMRIEVGKQGKDTKNYMATGPEFRKHLNFPAPTAAYVIGCHVGTVYAPFRSNDDYMSMAAVHAGTIAFLAPHNCQAICFWRYAPKGPGASQCFYFWENARHEKDAGRPRADRRQVARLPGVEGQAGRGRPRQGFGQRDRGQRALAALVRRSGLAVGRITRIIHKLQGAWSEPLDKWWVTHGVELLITFHAVLDRFAAAHHRAGISVLHPPYMNNPG